MRYDVTKTFAKATLSCGIFQATRTAGLVFSASPLQRGLPGLRGAPIETIALAMIAVATDHHLRVALKTLKQASGYHHRRKADEGWI